MKKLMRIVPAAVAVVSFAGTAFAEETAAAPARAETAADAPAGEAELEQEDTPWFEAGVDLDILSAYVWRNAVSHDELVMQPCVWFDFTRLDPFYLGGYVWQNWDFTYYRRQTAGVPMCMNETDFNVHVGATVWESDDEEYSVMLEIGNDFFTYRGIEDCPNSYELYVKAEFDNPFVGVYGQYSQAYNPVSAPYFELGLKKEVNIGEAFDSESDFMNRWTVGADWCLSFASGKYFTNYLYGPLPEGAYDPEEECYEDERNMSSGIGGTTLKGTVAYRVCDHFTLGAVIAFTSTLNTEADDALAYAECGCLYRRLVWGGVQAKFDF